MPWFGWLALAGGLVFLALTWFPVGALTERANRSFDPVLAIYGGPTSDPKSYFGFGYGSPVGYLLFCLAAVAYKAGVVAYKAMRAYWRFVQWLRG